MPDPVSSDGGGKLERRARERRARLSPGTCRYCEGSGKRLDAYGTPTGEDCLMCDGTGRRRFSDPEGPPERSEERIAVLTSLVRRAAPFVNAVAVMAEDKAPSLGWLVDAGAACGFEREDRDD